MSEKRDSGAMRRVSGWAEMERVGDYYFGLDNHGQRRLNVLLPGHAPFGPADEEAAFADLPIGPGPLAPWSFDGNEDAPTLAPSVNVVGHWHGFIRAGRYESC